MWIRIVIDMGVGRSDYVVRIKRVTSGRSVYGVVHYAGWEFHSIIGPELMTLRNVSKSPIQLLSYISYNEYYMILCATEIKVLEKFGTKCILVYRI